MATTTSSSCAPPHARAPEARERSPEHQAAVDSFACTPMKEAALSSAAGMADAELSLEQALSIAGWPPSLAGAEKQALVVNDLVTFERLLLFGSHIDRIIVLRNGIARLGLARALPRRVADAATGETSVRRFLDRLGDDETLRKMRGRVYCTRQGKRDEKELKRGAAGEELDTLADKRAALPKCADPRDTVYLGELRHATKYRHAADGRWSKSLLSRGVCDWIGRTRALAMPYWDRYDEGVFVGGRFGGSPLHVDQITWSNVGKNLAGHKLLAIWPYGASSRDIFDEHHYDLFASPLDRQEARAMAAAAQVALLAPGDVCVFSGGNAHMALSVSESLSLTAYESFVNLDPTNLAAFLDSGTPAQYRQCRARQPMLDDIKLEVADSLNDLAEDVEKGELRDAELEEHAHGAIAALRRDPLIGEKVAPLRPPRRRRIE